MSGPDVTRRQLLDEARRQLDEAIAEEKARGIRSARRAQELHDWIHGRTDRLSVREEDLDLWRAWGLDPDKPWAEQE